jgi:hypothetical protein
MTLKRLEKKLEKLSKKTIELHEAIIDKFGGRYRLGINGLGEYELTDLSKMKTIAKGEKNIQNKMIEMLKLA